MCERFLANPELHVLGHLCFSNSNIILFCSHLMRTFNDDKPIGPFLRKNTGSSESMICYSLHSAVENNQQPTKMERTEEDWEFECKSMCFSLFLLYISLH